MPKRLSVVAFVLLFAWRAQAHLMPSRQGTLNVVDNSVFQVLSVPVSALHGFDDDGDGVMSADELQRHGKTLREELDRRYVVRNGEAAGESMAVDLVLSPEHEAPTDRAAHVVVLKHTRFTQPVTDLRVSCDLFGLLDSERQLTITATRPRPSGKETEAAILTPSSTEHRFFRPPLEAFGEYVRIGAEHVLSGPDHLLFLLTVIVAGLGWRYWLAVVTGFTVAHSITLGAAMLGLVSLSPRIVEPAIALSIVATAIANLVWKEEGLRQRLALVCACGLLHGLGFAASMDAMGLDSAHRVLSLVGFNLGVEVGQAAFLIATMAVLFVGRRLVPRFGPPQVKWSISVIAVVIGSVWVVQRMAG